MQLLVIKITDLETKPEFALLGKKQIQDRFAISDWKHVRSLTRGRKVLILLTSNVVMTSISIPSKNRKQLLQAIPYALEDTLAEDIENLHFSVHQDTNNGNNESQVAIINHTLLTNILDLLKSQKITPNFILPELLAQKFEPNAWSINYKNIDNQISASVRLNQYQGFICDEQMLDIFITESLEKQKPSSVYSNTKPEIKSIICQIFFVLKVTVNSSFG